MTTNLEGPVAELQRIRWALTSLADALAAGRHELVTEAETRLSAALEVARPAGHSAVDPQARAELRSEVAGARAALDRCRRLGASLTAFVRCSLEAQGRCGAYDRAGHEAIAGRVGAINARG